MPEETGVEQAQSASDPQLHTAATGAVRPLDESTRLGLGIVGAALFVGIAGDALLRATPWGVNLVLWLLTLCVAAAALARWRGVEFQGEGKWAVPVLLLFGGAFAWRDSPTLNLLNLLGGGAALVLVLWHTRSGSLLRIKFLDGSIAAFQAFFVTIAGPLPLLLSDIRWAALPNRVWHGPAFAVLRGAVLALPLLLVFGGLFMAADADFEQLVRETFRWNFNGVFLHVTVVAGCAWVAGGWLRELMRPDTAAVEDEVSERRPGILGPIEAAVVLTLLNLLFLSFVVVQPRYLFGGVGFVVAETGPTFAEYARRGFFELVAVTALVLPLLLITHWLLRTDTPRQTYAFRALMACLVVLLSIIMVSAMQRMRLYQEAYGLTELRVYTTVFMLWLGVLLVWFLATVLRDRRRYFWCGVLVSGWITIAGLNLLNPDELIIRTNALRDAAEQPLDDRYATSLSADGVPALVEVFPTIREDRRCRVAARLLARWSAPPSPDWRNWNWDRVQAWWAVENNRALLLEAACPLPAGPR